MTRLFAISSAIAIAAAAPAVAQQVGPMATPATPVTEAPSEVTAPDAAQPGPVPPVDQPTPMTQPAPTAEAAPAAPAVDARAATVATLVEVEFPTYDTDKSGDLNQGEFSKWVLALHAKAEAAQAATAMDAKAKTTWAKNAFATADADKSKKITKTELNAFLLG